MVLLVSVQQQEIEALRAVASKFVHLQAIEEYISGEKALQVGALARKVPRIKFLRPSLTVHRKPARRKPALVLELI